MEELLEVVGGAAGWLVGIGVAVGLGSALSTGGKPLVKKAIKGYLALTDNVKVMAAEAGEQFQDLYAEARMEYDASKANGNEQVSSPAPEIIIPAGTDA